MPANLPADQPPRHTIAELRKGAATSPLPATVHLQIEANHVRQTRDGKPYRELALTDGTTPEKLPLRVWSDHPAFPQIVETRPQTFHALTATFATHPTYGLEARDWSLRPLDPEETATLLEGPPEVRARQAEDFAFLQQASANLADPRLRSLALAFLHHHGDRLRRTAGARGVHHARRGGLVEHTAQMLRCALALAPVYPEINSSLLVCGALFHDSGKLWENSYPERGFTMPWQLRGELIGHIPIGVELVNTLWRRLAELPENAFWQHLNPSSEDLRLHLLHLVLSHHGTREFGSPVEPKTPEAILLHFIDNIDARLEMFRHAYAHANRLSDQIFERPRPLTINIVSPLPHFDPALNPPLPGENENSPEEETAPPPHTLF